MKSNPGVNGQSPGRVSGVQVSPAWLPPACLVESCDIVIAPSVFVTGAGQAKGRDPRLLQWLRQVHERGAMPCSACSGIFPLAETGLLDDKDATAHFDDARAFGAAFPAVRIHPDRVLVIAGTRGELVGSGASSTWHDLALYLIARHVGATEAQEVARRCALQWHPDGLTPCITFEGRGDRGNAEFAAAQRWLAEHFSVASPVEAMIRRPKLAERTFKRRLTAPTGPTSGAYRKRFSIPEFARR